jgi:sugar transport system substrate-binding protein
MRGSIAAIAGVSVLTAVLLVVACGSGCGKPASGTAAKPKTKKLTIAGIVFQDDQFMRLVLFGMKQAADKAGAEFLQGCTYNKPDKEIELLSTYTARGVDAIVITPVSAKASVEALKMAHAKGIKIVTFNTKVDSDIPVAYVECSNESMGNQTGQAAHRYIHGKLGVKARVAILAFKSQLPEQSDARVVSFKNEIKDLPGVEFVAEQDAWLTEAAVKKAGDILTAHPDVNIIFAANEGGCLGAALAVKNAGKAGMIGVFGIGASEQIDGMIMSDDNILQAVTDASPIEIGRLAVERAMKAISGQTVEKYTALPGELVSREDMESVRKFDTKLKSAILTVGR